MDQSKSASEFNSNENELSEDIINNLIQPFQGEYTIGITYISTLGIDKPKKYIIFHPFKGKN